MPYEITFYNNIILFHRLQPCRHHPGSYRTREEAEAAAIELLPDIYAKFGAKAGYAILDSYGHVMTVGPDTNTD